jgi:hypothetical protein
MVLPEHLPEIWQFTTVEKSESNHTAKIPVPKSIIRETLCKKTKKSEDGTASEF